MSEEQKPQEESKLFTEEPKPQEQPAQSENVISDYYDGMKELEMKGHERGIKKARNTLLIIAGLTLVAEIISVSSLGVGFPPLVIAIIVAEVGLFVGLAFWTKTKPYTAILVGIIVYILFWIAAIIMNGTENIFRGAIIKIFIIVYLANALKDAKAWEELKKR
jgi:hypothetical protein